MGFTHNDLNLSPSSFPNMYSTLSFTAYYNYFIIYSSGGTSIHYSPLIFTTETKNKMYAISKEMCFCSTPTFFSITFTSINRMLFEYAYSTDSCSTVLYTPSALFPPSSSSHKHITQAPAMCTPTRKNPRLWVNRGQWGGLWACTSAQAPGSRRCARPSQSDRPRR